ncbi:hypothetical protein TSOC_003792, partial [Tetrabaena socialis]
PAARPRPRACPHSAAPKVAAPPSAPPAPEPAAAAAAPPSTSEPEDPKAALEKQIRNLKKKVRQCSDLEEKRAAGAALDKEQEEKLARAVAWKEEMEELENKLAKLGA